MTLVGYQNFRSSESLSGQPSVENGQSAELNQVSSTSGSRWMFLLWQASHSQASVRETVTWPQSSQYQAGDLVAPPELAGDAPVVDILHPVIIGLAEALGHELDAPVAHGLDGGLGQRLHLDEPLRARHRLDRRTAAVARADIMIIRFGLDEVALLLEIGQNGLARLVAVEAVVLAAVDDAGVLVER